MYQGFGIVLSDEECLIIQECVEKYGVTQVYVAPDVPDILYLVFDTVRGFLGFGDKAVDFMRNHVKDKYFVAADKATLYAQDDIVVSVFEFSQWYGRCA